MPLKKSSSKKAFVKNLKEELKTKPKKQALAIAYSVARKSGAKIPMPKDKVKRRVKVLGY